MAAGKHGSIGAYEGFGVAVRVSCYFTVGRPADFFGWLDFDWQVMNFSALQSILERLVSIC
jgi:hypothetical protein